MGSWGGGQALEVFTSGVETLQEVQTDRGGTYLPSATRWREDLESNIRTRRLFLICFPKKSSLVNQWAQPWAPFGTCSRDCVCVPAHRAGGGGGGEPGLPDAIVSVVVHVSLIRSPEFQGCPAARGGLVLLAGPEKKMHIGTAQSTLRQRKHLSALVPQLSTLCSGAADDVEAVKTDDRLCSPFLKVFRKETWFPSRFL